jgi:hypothetical protein
MSPGSVRMRDADEDSVILISDDDDMSGSGRGEGSDEEEEAYSYGSGGSDSGSGGPAPGSDDPTSEEADLGLLEDAAPGSSKSLGYRIVDGASLKRLQRGAIDDVAGIWGCAPAVAKTLLMYYMWDKERLLSEWRRAGPAGGAGGQRCAARMRRAASLRGACNRRRCPCPRRLTRPPCAPVPPTSIRAQTTWGTRARTRSSSWQASRRPRPVAAAAARRRRAAAAAARRAAAPSRAACA